MTYVEKVAQDLACGIFGVARGSIAYNATIGAIREVLADAAKEAHPGCADRCMHSECKGARDSVRRIDALADSEITV